MSLINIKNLTFSYDSHHDKIFDSVSMQMDTNWRIGLIGRNGQGKTTLLNILQNKLEYSGTISSEVNFDYFPFVIEDQQESIIELIDSLNDKIALWQIERELSLLEVDPSVFDRSFSSLSNGEQTKVMLAILFLKQSNFLLIDEPTNHLDTEARLVVANYLKTKRGFILVSHDRNFLDSCIDYVISINKTNIDIQKGNYTSWNQNRIYIEQNEHSENSRLKKDIQRLTKAAKKTENWSDQVEKSKQGKNLDKSLPYDKGHIGHMAAKMMKRSKSTQKRYEKAINDKEDLLKNIDKVSDLKITSLSTHNELLVFVDKLSISYNKREILAKLSFEVRINDRIALCGKNGSGKSSILKLLVNESIQHSGQIKLASGLVVSYVSQNTSYLSGSLDKYINEHGLNANQYKSILRKLGFSRNQFEKNIEEYSSGQKKKVLIARSLCEEAHLYVWDEPLNYLDIISRIQLEKLLIEYRPTIIFVEHDKEFVDNVATKRLDI